MKKTTFILLICLLIVRAAQAQGTVNYFSNVGQSFANSNPVASDSWLAVSFITGNNTTGYMLNSIQLGMNNATGLPSGFEVMLYTGSSNPNVSFPGSSLGALNGSLSPSTAGIYTYSPTSSLILSPATLYYIVLTAETTMADGAYEWNYSDVSSYNPIDNWGGAAVTLASGNGLIWSRLGSSPQYDYSAIAITATPVPEPSSAWLLLLGGGILFYVRKLRST